jgi:hypothetical protein
VVFARENLSKEGKGDEGVDIVVMLERRCTSMRVERAEKKEGRERRGEDCGFAKWLDEATATETWEKDKGAAEAGEEER